MIQINKLGYEGHVVVLLTPAVILSYRRVQSCLGWGSCLQVLIFLSQVNALTRKMEEKTLEKNWGPFSAHAELQWLDFKLLGKGFSERNAAIIIAQAAEMHWNLPGERWGTFSRCYSRKWCPPLKCAVPSSWRWLGSITPRVCWWFSFLFSAF